MKFDEIKLEISGKLGWKNHSFHVCLFVCFFNFGKKFGKLRKFKKTKLNIEKKNN